MEIGKLQETSEAISEGEWVDGIPSLPGVRLKVCASSSRPVKKAVMRAMRTAPKEDRTDNGQLTTEALDRVTLKSTVQHVLLDWDGLTENDKPVPFSVDMATQLMAYDEFAEGVEYADSQACLRRAKAIQDMAGNSKAPSTRKSAAA